MLAEIKALNDEWRAAERLASGAELALMAANRNPTHVPRAVLERAFALRADASSRLRVFLLACETASRVARGVSPRRSMHD